MWEPQLLLCQLGMRPALPAQAQPSLCQCPRAPASNPATACLPCTPARPPQVCRVHRPRRAAASRRVCMGGLLSSSLCSTVNHTPFPAAEQWLTPTHSPSLLIPHRSCSINPARSLGPAIVSGTWPTNFWIFVVDKCRCMLPHRLRCSAHSAAQLPCPASSCGRISCSAPHIAPQQAPTSRPIDLPAPCSPALPLLPAAAARPFVGAIFAIPFHMIFRAEWDLGIGARFTHLCGVEYHLM